MQARRGLYNLASSNSVMVCPFNSMESCLVIVPDKAMENFMNGEQYSYEDDFIYQDLVPVGSTTHNDLDPMLGGDNVINYADYGNTPLPYVVEIPNDTMVNTMEEMVITDSNFISPDFQDTQGFQSPSNVLNEMGEDENRYILSESSPQISDASSYPPSSIQSQCSQYYSMPSIPLMENKMKQTTSRRKRTSYTSQSTASPSSLSGVEKKVGRPRLPLSDKERRERKNEIAQKSRQRCRQAKQKEEEDIDKKITEYQMMVADDHIELVTLKLEMDLCKCCEKPRSSSV